jgi:FixJ family two-component response regulator
MIAVTGGRPRKICTSLPPGAQSWRIGKPLAFAEPFSKRGILYNMATKGIGSPTYGELVLPLQPGQGMSKGCVLVVDDEANARSALAELLPAEGYQVVTAADGFEALAKLKEVAPEVIFTDLKMPGMGGLDLLKNLRAQDSDASVIVMTGFAALDTAVPAMKAGAADYLTKPLALEELLLVLEREIARRALRREAEQAKARLVAATEISRHSLRVSPTIFGRRWLRSHS